MRNNTTPGHPEVLDVEATEDHGELALSPTLGFGYSITRYYDSVHEIGSYDRYDRIPMPGFDADEWWIFSHGEVTCYREVSSCAKWRYVEDYRRHTGRVPTEDHLAYVIFMQALRDWT